jgi:(2S)-methylsuccinyl-CoA dehydrogenase
MKTEMPMSTAAVKAAEMQPTLSERTNAIVRELDGLLDLAAQRVRERVTVDGRISSSRMEAEQRATHGLAWFATYVEALRQLDAYAQRLTESGRYGDLEDQDRSASASRNTWRRSSAASR